MSQIKLTARVEIRAAEGGEDSKLLVKEQAALYEAYARARGLRYQESHEPG